MEQKILKKTIHKLEDAISSLIISTVDLEQFRKELISNLDEKSKEEITTLEKSYFYPGPPKVLHIAIPSVPVTLNHAVRFRFAKDRYAFHSIFEFWNIKIKNALNNLKVNKSCRDIIQFEKAIVLYKFTFSDELLRDLDNYAIKGINDALVKNGVLKDDNYKIADTLATVITNGKELGVDIFVTDDKFIKNTIAGLYHKIEEYCDTCYKEYEDKAKESIPIEKRFFGAAI